MAEIDNACRYCNDSIIHGPGKCPNRGAGEEDPAGLNPSVDMGAKLDANKPDMSLLIDFGQALKEVAMVGTFGMKKYKRGSWLHVKDGIVRYTAADLRHIMAENHEVYDKDSGLKHAAHHAWNALSRLELMIRGQ